MPVVRVHSAHCEIPSNNIIRINFPLDIKAKRIFRQQGIVSFEVLSICIPSFGE